MDLAEWEFTAYQSMLQSKSLSRPRISALEQKIIPGTVILRYGVNVVFGADGFDISENKGLTHCFGSRIYSFDKNTYLYGITLAVLGILLMLHLHDGTSAKL